MADESGRSPDDISRDTARLLPASPSVRNCLDDSTRVPPSTTRAGDLSDVNVSYGLSYSCFHPMEMSPLAFRIGRATRFRHRRAAASHADTATRRRIITSGGDNLRNSRSRYSEVLALDKVGAITEYRDFRSSYSTDGATYDFVPFLSRDGAQHLVSAVLLSLITSLRTYVYYVRTTYRAGWFAKLHNEWPISVGRENWFEIRSVPLISCSRYLTW